MWVDLEMLFCIAICFYCERDCAPYYYFYYSSENTYSDIQELRGTEIGFMNAAALKNEKVCSYWVCVHVCVCVCELTKNGSLHSFIFISYRVDFCLPLLKVIIRETVAEL